MAGRKKPGLAAHVKPMDTESAAAVAEKLAGGPSKPTPSAAADNEPLASQSYNLPLDQIGLLADLAAARAHEARKNREKGRGRISASSILREVIEKALPELEAELRRLRG